MDKFLDFDMIIWYLRESEGDPWLFRSRLNNGQRLGQAFFNSLKRTDQQLIVNSDIDPFHDWTNDNVAKCIDFLTSKESDIS